jgi:hypothetical protein
MYSGDYPRSQEAMYPGDYPVKQIPRQTTENSYCQCKANYPGDYPAKLPNTVAVEQAVTVNLTEFGG